MPSNCIWFERESARSISRETIQNVLIIDQSGRRRTPGLRIHDANNDGRNELFINSGTAVLMPRRAEGIYQVIVEATKYAGHGRVGVYTIEAVGDSGVVATAANLVAEERIAETFVLTSSSDKPIWYITITGAEVAVEKVCFISE